MRDAHQYNCQLGLAAPGYRPSKGNTCQLKPAAAARIISTLLLLLLPSLSTAAAQLDLALLEVEYAAQRIAHL